MRRLRKARASLTSCEYLMISVTQHWQCHRKQLCLEKLPRFGWYLLVHNYNLPLAVSTISRCYYCVTTIAVRAVFAVVCMTNSWYSTDASWRSRKNCFSLLPVTQRNVKNTAVEVAESTQHWHFDGVPGSLEDVLWQMTRTPVEDRYHFRTQ
jgi:hypothetical protein